jgi:hypothetical protein
LTYTQAKDMLIVEGDGWSDAELFTQEGPGRKESRYVAKKFNYIPKTGQATADGIHSLETILPPGKPTAPGKR